MLLDVKVGSKWDAIVKISLRLTIGEFSCSWLLQKSSCLFIFVFLVGKTSLITRFMYDSFDNTYQVSH